ncbi:MAG: iron chelate uptake ABC transporter family permease subunit [Verrucomicrobiales bacterium]|nr:iron chelate uptake ABC transporter family permease subunit [Verrucomicrobiales bacterium]
MSRNLLIPGLLLVLFVTFGIPGTVSAERISDLVDNSVWEQAKRILSLKDPTVRIALTGCLLLGVCCGLLGSIIVVRQFALAGDTLAHAVLPGIALGYLWAMEKSPIHLFIGAIIAGVIGSVVVSLIQQTTRLKRDTSLGIVLGGFYAIGIVLVSMVQNHMPGDAGGLKSFLFGKAAAMTEIDLVLIATITGISLVIFLLFFGQLKVVSFDATFARSIGISERFYHYLLMLLLAWAVVSALQAVGVVLVSAMLVIPASTAYLLTDRLHWMVVFSVIIGMIVSTVGVFISFLGPGLPTGPFIVLTAASVFSIVFIAAPRHGRIAKWWSRRKQSHQIRRENVLKAIYHLQEADDFENEWVGLSELIGKRKKRQEEVLHEIDLLDKKDLVEWDREGERLRFEGAGLQRAKEIVRNHRLWELYLTNKANIAPDHVHDDAEKIEHILGEDLVREMEKSLEDTEVDPHGKEIPTVR